MKSFLDIVAQRAQRQPETALYTWLDDQGEEAGRLSAGGLDLRARALGAWLRAAMPAGGGQDAPALLLFPPGLEFVTAFCGCLYAGAVAVPAYPPRGARSLPRLTAIAADARPRAVLTTAALLPRVRAWMAGEPALAGVAVAAVDEIDDAAATGWRHPGVGPDALAFLQYTSGSSAEPKGVMVRHGNLLHNEEMIRRAFGQDEESVVVSWLPLYHDMGLIGGVLQPLYSGGRCVLTAPGAFLKRPALWLEAIDRYRATTSGGPNFAYELCTRKVGAEERQGFDLSCWRVAFNGSEPVRPDTLERFAAAFAPCGFRPEALYPCYGLAEATLFVAGGAPHSGAATRSFAVADLEAHRAVPADGDGARALTACGRPWMGQRLVVVDPDSRRPLAAGEVGEIWIAGPSVAAGYWGRPEATARDFAAQLAGGEAGEEAGEETADGGSGRWLRTGDLGFLHGAAGSEELFVTGRLKDLIILRGRNVYPQDVEGTAEAAHAALRAGCSAAFAAEADGEERLVLACEVDRHAAAEPGALAEIAEAVRWAVFEAHEAPVHEVVLLRTGTLPKTSSGKVRRSACRAAWEAGSLAGRLDRSAPDAPPEPAAAGPGAGAGPEPSRELLERLREWAAPLLRTAPEGLAVDRPLIALGLDSLAAAELQQVVEAELGLTLDLGDLLEGASLEEIAERVAAGRAATDGEAEAAAGAGGHRPPAEP
ncbi:MAG TPA: AMP-binding protein, partial [Thermoanaerobaculia bacterium]|nr:AMP-binding protein [Thermoanaerobaculia bacterium]